MERGEQEVKRGRREEGEGRAWREKENREGREWRRMFRNVAFIEIVRRVKAEKESA